MLRLDGSTALSVSGTVSSRSQMKEATLHQSVSFSVSWCVFSLSGFFGVPVECLNMAGVEACLKVLNRSLLSGLIVTVWL